MLIIGLTGPSGSGKGTVSAMFAAYGVPAIDTDRVYHDLLVPPSACLDELTHRFGTAILSADGTLNRGALASVVFAPGHEKELDDLNHITHKHVLERTRQMCDELALQGCRTVLVDAPLLFECGFDSECDDTVAVLSTYENRLARIMARDGLTPEAAEARMRAQKPDAFYTQRAHRIIYNNGSPADMDEAVHKLIQQWEVMAT